MSKDLLFTNFIARIDLSGVKSCRFFLLLTISLWIVINGSDNLRAQSLKSGEPPCAGTTIPYYENFDSYPSVNEGAVGTIPSCWGLIPGSSNPFYYPRVNSYLAVSGNAMLITSGPANNGSTNYVVLPSFTSSLEGLKLSFKTKMSNANLGVLTLGYVTDIEYDTTFSALQVFPSIVSEQSYQFSFDDLNIPDSARVAFRWTVSINISIRCAIDDIAVEFIPCEPVDNVVVSDVMMTTADVSWNPGDDESAWKVEYGPSGFALGAGDTILSVDTNYITITNLTGNQPYDVYVRAACEEANQSESSPVVSFTPYCSVTADTIHLSACDHFEWLGNTLNHSGVYVDTLPQAATYSCDSIVILDLTIHSTYNQYDTLVICQNELPYLWRDTTFDIGTVDSNFVFNRQSVHGCDSVVNLCLFVNPSFYQTENEVICQNELPYTWRDTIFETGTISGAYILSRQTVNGCDSFVTLNLTVNPSFSPIEIVHICQSELPYTWRDTTFQVGTISAVHTFYRHSQFGCDSIVTLVLMVKPTFNEEVTLYICRGELPYSWRDTTFDEGTISDVYLFSRQATNHCDSLVTLYLNVHDAVEETITAEICDTELPYTWRDTVFEMGTTSGDFHFNRQTTLGCDSNVIFNLRVNPAFYQNSTVSICQNELPFSYQDTLFDENTTSGDYRLVRVTDSGCDSIYTLHLTVYPIYNEEVNLQICEDVFPYTWRDTIFDTGTASGNYTFRRHTQSGCDSTTILHLTVFETYRDTVPLSVCENDLPMEWRNHVLPRQMVSGYYTYSDLNQNGCDSVVVLSLTVNPSYRHTESLTICANELPYTWRDTTFEVGTLGGTFLFEGQSVTGCDSTVILKLKVNPYYDYAESLSICMNDLPYTWNDTVFAEGTTTNTFTFRRQTTQGCDSIVTLSLIVHPDYQQNTTLVICSNELPYTWRDTVFEVGSTTGIYSFERHSINGCDSLFTLTFVVMPVYESETFASLCQNEFPYSWQDTVFQEGTISGTYYLTRPSHLGCDSIFTLHLTVYPTYHQTEALVICQDELPYTWRDTTFNIGTASGVYHFVRSSQFGCDSLVSLALIVNQSYYLTENEVICDNGFPYQWRDTIFETGTETGDYTFYRQTVNGCDSVVTLHLTVNSTYDQTESLVICQNELPYTWRDTTFQVGSLSGIYSFSRESSQGCDSLVTLALTVNPSYLQTYNEEICENDLPYQWQDNVFSEGTESGVYTFNHTSIAGCDSIIVLNLTVFPSYQVSVELELCRNELPYQWGNIIFPIGTTNGDFTQTFVSRHGCDSIVDLALIVHPDYDLHEQLRICENDLPYTWRDTVFEQGTTSGTFSFERISQFGCDSVVTLHVVLSPNYEQNEELIICANDLPYEWRDTTFDVGTLSNLFVFNRLSVAGCDSIVQLNLIVNPSYYNTDTLEICSNELPYTWDGYVFPIGTNSGDVVFYHSSEFGCDSTITLNLTVNPSYEQFESIGVCANDFPYSWRDTVFAEGTESGTFTFRRQTISGCDSIVHLTLTVNALPTVAILGDTIIEPGTYTMLVATFGVGYTYLWSNGDQGNIINVSPMEDTYYSVTVTNSEGCSASDSVLVTLIDTTGIRDHQLETMVLIYPNPAVRNVTISAHNEEIREVEFYNMLGALVKKESVRQNEAVIEISELKKGNYLLRIILQNGDIVREKLIVQ